MKVAILGSSGGWHAQQLTDALAARGHEHRLVPVTRMLGRIDGDVAVRGGDSWLERCDAVIVRGIPRGSLEQVIFRVDALHALVERADRDAAVDASDHARDRDEPVLVAARRQRVGQLPGMPAAAGPEDPDRQPQNERSSTSRFTRPASKLRPLPRVVSLICPGLKSSGSIA